MIGWGKISNNIATANTHNNHRHCCYVIEQLEYAHLWILAGATCSVGSVSAESGWRQIAASLYDLQIR